MWMLKLEIELKPCIQNRGTPQVLLIIILDHVNIDPKPFAYSLS